MKNKMKSFFNDNGFIAMAFAIVLVSLMSVIAIARIGVTDTRGLVTSYHALQELHIIRSETVRSLKATENMMAFTSGATSALPGIIDMGGTVRELDSGFGVSTFRVRTIIEKESDISSGLFDISNNYGINSLVTAYVGKMINKNKTKSRVSFYGKKIIKRNSFAGYHYFTDQESSINSDMAGGDDPVKFWGADEIWGKVRSNTDIYIQKGGGGSNNGWPIFHDHVYTSGEIISVSGGYPLEDVFRGGLTENLPQIEFPENANEARTGNHLEIGPNEILFVTVEGSSYSAWLGTKFSGMADTVWVHSVVGNPTPEAARLNNLSQITLDTLGFQILTKVDTVWNRYPGGRVNNNSVFVTGELWIKGTFAGRQTWASQDTMYLAGDILLAGTDKGEVPDGGEGPMNSRDMVGLISEKSIVIQYGYRDPEDSVRVKNNIGRLEGFANDTGDGGIYIYAALCALGKGNTSMEDGVFSFQYQHPHKGLFALKRATPDGQVSIAELQHAELFSHRLLHDGWGPLHFWFKNQPWPSAFCYPSYGPLWPEPNHQTHRERGTVNLFGSVAQRRRGYIHRSGGDPNNHPSNGEWNLNEYHYGSNDNGVNAPGTDGSGVGYRKEYRYDNRFRVNPPPKFPEVKLVGGVTQFDAASWYLISGKDAPRMLHE